MQNIICVITDLTDAELRIKKMYCNDILSILNTLGSGDSIKKGKTLFFYKEIRIFINFFNSYFRKK